MVIFEQLKNNKGTVSSSLAKDMAKDFFSGTTDILTRAIELSVYEADNPGAKHIRAGAAKIVEIVAEKKPGLVAPFLEKLIPALRVEEPQTRWMTLRTMGFCAHVNTVTACKALPFARECVHKKDGVCLAGSADLFLGDLGAVSKKEAQKVFPLLLTSAAAPVKNEHDWILEAFIKIIPNIKEEQKVKIKDFVHDWTGLPKKATQKRIKKILILLG